MVCFLLIIEEEEEEKKKKKKKKKKKRQTTSLLLFVGWFGGFGVLAFVTHTHSLSPAHSRIGLICYSYYWTMAVSFVHLVLLLR